MLIVKYEVLSYGFSQGLSSGFPLQPNTQICPHHKKHIRTSYPKMVHQILDNTYGSRYPQLTSTLPRHAPSRTQVTPIPGKGLTWQWSDVAVVWRGSGMTWQRLTIDTKQYDYDFLNTLTKICQKYLNHVLYTIDICSHHNQYYYIQNTGLLQGKLS